MNAFKNWLSRYHPQYVRSIVYMLQASEYNIRDYLTWYHRTTDFLHVERRQKLKQTSKAMLLLGLGFLILTALYVDAFFILFSNVVLYRWLVFILEIVLAPYLFAYLIIVPLVIIEWLVQKPMELVSNHLATQKLREHKGLKIAIAGSFGKTTMREILHRVLSSGKEVAATPHNNNTPVGIRRFIRNLKGTEDIILFELGEYYEGDVRMLCKMIAPDMGIITGVNEAHLSKFKTLETTTRTVFELADYLFKKPLYVNAENQIAKDRAPRTAILYTRDRCGAVEVGGAQTGLEGTTFTLTAYGRSIEVQSALLGLHHVGPLAAAADIALSVGLSLEHVANGIRKTEAFPHRLEKKQWANGVTLLDDTYNGNPDGVRAVIEFLSHIERHRRWYVTPGLVELGQESGRIHRAIGKQLAHAHIEKIALITNSVTPAIMDGLVENGYKGEIIWFPDMPAALKGLPSMTIEGDVVLLQNDWGDQYA